MVARSRGNAPGGARAQRTAQPGYCGGTGRRQAEVPGVQAKPRTTGLCGVVLRSTAGAASSATTFRIEPFVGSEPPSNGQQSSATLNEDKGQRDRKLVYSRNLRFPAPVSTAFKRSCGRPAHAHSRRCGCLPAIRRRVRRAAVSCARSRGGDQARSSSTS